MGLPWLGNMRAPCPEQVGLHTTAREPPSTVTRESLHALSYEDPKQPIKKKKKEFAFQVGYLVLLCSRRIEHRIGTDGPTGKSSVACEPWKEIWRALNPAPVINGNGREGGVCTRLPKLRQHPSQHRDTGSKGRSHSAALYRELTRRPPAGSHCCSKAVPWLTPPEGCDDTPLHSAPWVRGPCRSDA